MPVFCTEFINGATGKMHIGPDITAASWDEANAIAAKLSIGAQPVKVYGLVGNVYDAGMNTPECWDAAARVLDEVKRVIGGKS